MDSFLFFSFRARSRSRLCFFMAPFTNSARSSSGVLDSSILSVASRAAFFSPRGADSSLLVSVISGVSSVVALASSIFSTADMVAFFAVKIL